MRLTRSSSNEEILAVLNEVADVITAVLASNTNWGLSGLRHTQYSVDVDCDNAALAILHDAGCAVLVVSEELDELFELCDRMHVMAQGRISPSLSRAQATVAKIGSWMSGLWTEDKEKVH